MKKELKNGDICKVAAKDLIHIGLVCGEYTVIGLPFKKKGCSNYVCECQCSCGKVRTVSIYHILNESVYSCGCQTKLVRTVDIGTKIGNLTSTSKPYFDGHEWVINCVCDCGEKCIKNFYRFHSGLLTGCGTTGHKQRLIKLSKAPKRTQPTVYPGFKCRKYTAIYKTGKIKETDDFKEGEEWVWKCECGNLRLASLFDLKSIVVDGCYGCKSKFKPTIDYTNKILNDKWEILGYIKINKEKPTSWVGKCKGCGNIVVCGAHYFRLRDIPCKCTKTNRDKFISNIFASCYS